MNEQPGWYLTAPRERVTVRRGDPLGFRVTAEHYAELLAPGLSNASSDARWITLLSWCLHWSDVVWQQADGRDLSARDAQSARYAWLRPLELLWVDRTLEAGQSSGQLRGLRSVKRWRDAKRKPPNFDMSAEQFRRFRQVGTYGAYRVVFRGMQELTTGDGWTPAGEARKLADIVNSALPAEFRLKRDDFGNGVKWAVWTGREAQYWITKGWPAAGRSDSRWPKHGTRAAERLLPADKDRIGTPLPEPERRVMESVLFSIGSTRRTTAECLARAKHARSHAELADALAGSTKLTGLEGLPAFTRFADAATHAMRGLWDQVWKNGPAPDIGSLARSQDLRERLDRARERGGVWLGQQSERADHRARTVTLLAQTLAEAEAPADQIRALVGHHQAHGGGRRWFEHRSGRIVPLLPDAANPAADYRFRLRALTRLAAQCGVARLGHTLDAVERSEFAEAVAPDDEDNAEP